MGNIPGEKRAMLWVLIVAGSCMLPVAGFFCYYHDWPAVVVNLFGSAGVIGFATYHLLHLAP